MWNSSPPTHTPTHPQIPQKYIYMWNSPHWKLADRLLYNQSCKQDPQGTGRKGREVTELKPVPLGRRLRKKEGTREDTCPGE